MRTCFSDNNLIRVGVDHEVRIVGDHDHLALCLRRNEKCDQLVEYGFWIKILFRLVDDQRPVIGIVERQIEQQ